MLASRSFSTLLVAVAILLAPAIDVLVLGSGHLISSLYGVPVLIAAPLWRPRAVCALAATMVLFHATMSAFQRDDPELWLLYTLSLLMIAVLAIIVSSQRQQIQQRARDADAARAQLQTFLSMVAHELAAPTTGILGQAQFALRTAQGTRERRALLTIEAEAKQLARFIQDLRDAARLGAGSFELATERVDTGALVASVVGRWRATASGRTIELAEDEPLPLIDGDRQRLAQVLDNLISNALKYSPRDAPVEIEAHHDAEHVVIAVNDRGPGIPAQLRAALFQPFSRLPGSEGIAGTGLGLYITRAIVAAHGGSIDVADRAGGGSTFTVRLPCAGGDAGEVVADRTPA